jgi:hypothetical protein
LLRNSRTPANGVRSRDLRLDLGVLEPGVVDLPGDNVDEPLEVLGGRSHFDDLAYHLGDLGAGRPDDPGVVLLRDLAAQAVHLDSVVNGHAAAIDPAQGMLLGVPGGRRGDGTSPS